MQDDSTVWNTIFAREGVVFLYPHDDIPRLTDMLIQLNAGTILDLGCGNGRHVLYFSRRGFTVYGIDSAPAGIALTQQRLQEVSLTAHLSHHDIFAGLPFDDASFDAIVFAQVIHHALIAQIRSLVEEMTRILKPDGLLFVTVPQLKNQGTQSNKLSQEPTYLWMVVRLDCRITISQKRNFVIFSDDILSWICI